EVLTFHLLRRHVGRSAQGLSRARDRSAMGNFCFRAQSQPEVCDHRACAFFAGNQNNVSWLEIAVQYSRVMRRAQTCRNLLSDRQRILSAHSQVALQTVGEGLSL